MGLGRRPLGLASGVNPNLNGDARQAGRIFVHMVAETIVELRESGVEVLDSTLR